MLQKDKQGQRIDTNNSLDVNTLPEKITWPQPQP